MDLGQRSIRCSSNGPPTMNPLQTSQFDDETESRSSIQCSFQEISPILPQPAPFLQNPSNTSPSTQNKEPVPSSCRLRSSRNGGSFNGQSEHRDPKVMLSSGRNIGTGVLRRSASEGVPSRDSGIAFNTANGLHNTKVSARAMDRAMCNKRRRRPDRSPIQIQSQLHVPERASTHLSTSMDHQWSNCIRTSHRTNHKLGSLPPTTGLNQKEVKGGCLPRFSSLRRTGRQVDETAIMHKEIGDQDELTQKRILEGHLDKTFKVLSPPLSEGPGKGVEFVMHTGREEEEVSGRFGDVEAEGKMKEQLKRKSAWGRMVRKVRGWSGKSTQRQ